MTLTGAALPHNPETEQAVLACALLEPEIALNVLDSLQVDDFHLPKHQLIFQAMDRIRGAGSEVDLLTVQAALDVRGELGKVGGISYVSGMVDQLPDLGRVEQYVAILRELRLRRDLHAACLDTARRCLDGGETPREVLSSAHSRLSGLEERSTSAALSSWRDVMQETTVVLDTPRGKSTGLRTGFRDLDSYTEGLEPGQLIVIAGRTGMGKSALGQALVEECCFEQEMPAAVFSLEMAKLEWACRVASSRSGVDLKQIRSGLMSAGSKALVRRTLQGLAGYPLWIDDTGEMTPQELTARSRKLYNEQAARLSDEERADRRRPLALIVVDYLQLLNVTGGGENRNLEIGAATRALKLLAKDLHVPVVVLSQLSRQPDLRPDHRPRLSDLRDSGSIEQDADVVLFVHREAHYGETTENRNQAEIIIAKQRNGPTGRVYVDWIPEIASFRDPSRGQRQQQADMWRGEQ